MISAIAIDDEPPALKVLEVFCAKTDFIDLQKTFNKPAEAQKHLRKFPVDLLFLDINMPSINGLELHREISQDSMVIFTTAYSEYAVEGFNLNAVDYLLKPFTLKRFLQSMEKVKELYNFRKVKTKEGPQYLLVRADYSLVKIDLEDILFIEGLDDYLKIHLVNGKPVIARMTIKSVVEKLPSHLFIRVHRSYVVPLQKIASVRNKVIAIGTEEIPIGSSYEEIFLKLFNK
jgi:DNA-binding LytR/AlgR family response regulator